MKRLIQPTGEYSVMKGPNGIHEGCRNWFSEIEFWKTELHFLKKLLDQYADQFNDLASRQKIDQFQHFVSYYTGGLLDETQKEIRKHERTFAIHIASYGNKQDDDSCHARHSELANKMEGLKIQIMNQKEMLFQFIEQAI